MTLTKRKEESIQLLTTHTDNQNSIKSNLLDLRSNKDKCTSFYRDVNSVLWMLKFLVIADSLFMF